VKDGTATVVVDGYEASNTFIVDDLTVVHAAGETRDHPYRLRPGEIVPPDVKYIAPEEPPL